MRKVLTLEVENSRKHVRYCFGESVWWIHTLIDNKGVRFEHWSKDQKLLTPMPIELVLSRILKNKKTGLATIRLVKIENQTV